MSVHQRLTFSQLPLFLYPQLNLFLEHSEDALSILPNWSNRPKPVMSVAYYMLLLHITFDAVSFQFVIEYINSCILLRLMYLFCGRGNNARSNFCKYKGIHSFSKPFELIFLTLEITFTHPEPFNARLGPKAI